MVLQYGVFQMPRKVLVDVEYGELQESNEVMFSWAPFDRGMGHTIGNSLRRVLLSSIEAAAVVGVKIDGFLHEFMAIDGVIEDMLNISLNCKGILVGFKKDVDLLDPALPREFFVNSFLEVTESDLKENGGNRPITVRDVFVSDVLDAFNKDHALFTVTSPMSMNVSFRVRIGRGFVPVSKMGIKDRREFEVLLDGVFSPVKTVTYSVDPFRVGMDTDFDKLSVKVVTDGRVSAKDAVSAAVQVLSFHCSNMEGMVMESITFAEEATLSSMCEESAILAGKLIERIEDMDLGVRAFNCLHESGVEYVVELLLYTESELLCIKNLGRKSLDEIKQRLIERGLFLGMDISKFDINKENVKERVAELKSDAAAIKN